MATDATQTAAHAFHNANFPVDEDGRVYHLGLKQGEIANRIVTVGDPKRAELLSTFLDKDSLTTTVKSKRGFNTYTGTFNGVAVSIVSIGMGRPMMDFLLREARAIVEGPMVLIRLGTCGTPRIDVRIGSVAVASEGAVEVVRLSDTFDVEDSALPAQSPTQLPSERHYFISKPCPADAELSAELVKSLHEQDKTLTVIEGLNATADSFYSSQGRIDVTFDDRNDSLLKDMVTKYPTLQSIEMETYQLLHLARCARPAGSIRATAVAIILANRITNDFLDPTSTHDVERKAGMACLATVTSVPLSPDAHPVSKKARVA